MEFEYNGWKAKIKTHERAPQGSTIGGLAKSPPLRTEYVAHFLDSAEGAFPLLATSMMEAEAEAKGLIDRGLITRDLRELEPTRERMELEANWRDRLTADEREMANHLENQGWTSSLSHHWKEPHELTFRWSKAGENHADSDPYSSPSGLNDAFRQASRRTGQLNK